MANDLTLTETPAAPKIVAFYGYKGGAGRSMLAANVAATLALAGKRILLIDWDLEAPGIGDFLDVDGNDIPESWRRSRGVLEMLGESVNSPPAELPGRLKAIMADVSQGGYVLPVALPGKSRENGGLSLMGPGAQVGTAFPEALMGADWLRFFETYGKGFYDAFRQAVGGGRFDVVLIDTRTGLNLSTMYIMRVLAESVYFLTPKTHEGLEGTDTVWRLLKDMLSDTEDPDCKLVLTRFKAGAYQADRGSRDGGADIFIREVFGEGREDYKADFEFPAVDTLGDSEHLLMSDWRVREALYLNNEDSPVMRSPGFGSYRASFFKLCDQIGALETEKLPWASLLPSVAESQLADATRTNLDSRFQLDDGFLLWDRLTAVLEARRDAPPVVVRSDVPIGGGSGLQKHEGLPEVEQLVQWLDRAPHFLRSALRRYAWRRDPSGLEFPQAVRERLWLDLSSSDMAAFIAARETAGTPQRNEKAQPKGGADSIRQRADGFWGESKRLERDDDPLQALEALNKATVLTREALRVTRDEAGRTQLLNNLAIFLIDRTLLMASLADWDAAILLVEEALRSAEVSISREPDAKREVSRVDLCRLLISIACDKMEGGAQSLSREQSALLAVRLKELHSLSLMEKWDEQERESSEMLLARYDQLVAVFEGKPGPELAALARRRAELARHSLETRFEELDLPGCFDMNILELHGQAFAALWSGSETDRVQLSATLTDTGKTASQLRVSGEGPSVEMSIRVANLASLLASCGRLLDAYDLYQISLRLIGKGTDGWAVCQRTDILLSIALLENNLGRPDMAAASVEALAKMLADARPPGGSTRDRRLRNITWWPSAIRSEYGQLTVILAELSRLRDNFGAEGAATGLPSYMRFDGNSSARQVLGWLPSITLDMGYPERVGPLVREREDDLLPRLDFELDNRRTFAKLKRVEAIAAYCLGDCDAALAAIEQGLACNASGAAAFGAGYALCQHELRILREEVRAFGGHGADLESLAETIEDIRAMERSWRDDPRARDWFHSTRITCAKLLAVAAAVWLRHGEARAAGDLAAEVETYWLAAATAGGKKASSRWQKSIAEPALAVAKIVGFCAGNRPEGVSPQQAWQVVEALPKRRQVRYKGIFDFCRDFLNEATSESRGTPAGSHRPKGGR